MKTSFKSLVVVVVALFAAFQSPVEAEGRRLKVLMLGHKPGMHAGHVTEERYMQLYRAMGPRGINLEFTADPEYALKAETLKNFDALALYANWGEITPEQEKALFEYVESGHGFVPIHCASYCFLNSMKCTALIGGRFKRHNTGDFETTITEPEHPIMKGFVPFKTWDETYVHEFHNPDKLVLQRRVDAGANEDEPWTWVRNQGAGRVFYTAYGHDERTWAQAGFQDLIYRGIVRAVGDTAAGEFAQLKLAPLKYVDGAQVPNYEKRDPAPKLQEPLSPADAQGHIYTPAEFDLSLFASEADSEGGLWNVMEFKFDERGRMWTCESKDYPNEIQKQGEGRDRIRILEDTNGDGKADKFTVFAEGISIPTSLEFWNGGVIVMTPPDTIFLKDTNGDDKCDEKKALFSGWGFGDTHAVCSNTTYGLDGWIYGSVGYSGFDGTVGGEKLQFPAGAYRFRPDGSKLEFLGQTSNNTWGFSFTEDGDILGSTANGQPSWYCAIPKRYYAAVPGLEQGVLPGVDTTKKVAYMREYIRQVDVMGGFTAAACHNFYTARTFPKRYWNSIALVAEPTCHVLFQGVVRKEGSNIMIDNGWNLMASDDEWFAPVYAAVGPDGGVYVSDFYSFLIQHNPTPSVNNGGFDAKTGKGNAFVSDLRDTEHARLWKVFPKDGKPCQQWKLSKDKPEELLAALRSDNEFWRKHAQRLLIERGNKDVVEKLRAQAAETTVDELGLNGAALGALWTLAGLGETDLPTLTKALTHPAAGVRRAALTLLPRDATGSAALATSGALTAPDAFVKLAALLAASEMPASPEMGAKIYEISSAPDFAKDKYLPVALTMAAAPHAQGFLGAAIKADTSVAAEPAKVEAVNLLKNPSFETLEGDQPAPWFVRTYSGEAKQTVDTTVAHTGKNSLRIESTKGSDCSWSYNTPLEPNSTYVFSGWIKTENLGTAGGAKGAMLQLHQLNGKQPFTMPLKGTSDWTFVTLTFESGGATDTSLNLLYGGWGPSTGVAWWDDISLVKTGAASKSDASLMQIASAFARNAAPEAKTALGTVVAASKGNTAAVISKILLAGGVGEKKETLDDLKKTHFVVKMATVPGAMKYDKAEYTAPAGRPIVIVLLNNDVLQHNVMAGKPGSFDKLAAAATAMLTAPDGLAKSFIPDLPESFGGTKLADPKELLFLKLPALEPGDYPLICTFPGHSALMKAVLKVTK